MHKDVLQVLFVARLLAEPLTSRQRQINTAEPQAIEQSQGGSSSRRAGTRHSLLLD